MKVATLQFNPSLGSIQHNIDRANALLQSQALRPGQIDLLVLPEMAFTGYNFPDLASMKPFLEPKNTGPTSLWALDTSKRLNCHVIVGYPEFSAEEGRNYNATVTCYAGQIIAHYRKSFLYYTDETWASEGPHGSAKSHTNDSCHCSADQQRHTPFFTGPIGKLGRLGHGICMDINPYRFEAAWTEFEFANTMLRENVKLVVLSTAWLTRLLPEELDLEPEKPDMETVAYWLERFYPFLEAEHDCVVVFANRCGMEGNKVRSVHVENGQEVEEGDRVCYAGSSTVIRFQRGKAIVFESKGGPAILGKGEEGCLAVDTLQRGGYSLKVTSEAA